MNLIIHDLSVEEWDKIASQYEGFEVISDNHASEELAQRYVNARSVIIPDMIFRIAGT